MTRLYSRERAAIRPAGSIAAGSERFVRELNSPISARVAPKASR